VGHPRDLVVESTVFRTSIGKVPGSIAAAVIKNNKNESSVITNMTVNHLKVGVEQTPETSCIPSIPHAVYSIKHSIFHVLSMFMYKILYSGAISVSDD
jgi:hypothetical protein